MRDFLYILLILLILFLIFYTYYAYTNNTILKKIDCEKSEKLLVLRNYNPEAGLHWMGVFNVIKMFAAAKKYNLKPVVILDSGLYLEKDSQHIQNNAQYIDQNNNEWFSYYFEPIGINEPRINQLWKEDRLNNLPSLTQYSPDKCVIGYNFDREALNSVPNEIDFCNIYKECIKPKPYLQQSVDNFYNKNMSDRFLIGIHVRGTDKYSSSSSSEDNPKHFNYQQYCNIIEKEIIKQKQQQPSNTKIAVFACSDEQPFIEYITTTLGKKYEVITTGNVVLRSNISTSGLDLKSELCDGINDSNIKDCEIYNNLAGQSIHRGFKDYSNFKKGYDAVFEVLLLSKCHVFYKSRGNFSNSVCYANKNLQVHDMVNYCTENVC